jgi:hypothetical protein
MASTVLNQANQIAILAVEEAPLTANAAIGDSTVQVSGYYMSATPFSTDGIPYIICDYSWSAGANGIPNAEQIIIDSTSGVTATPVADGLGYAISGYVHVKGYDSTGGFTSTLKNAYTTANSASILTPGQEVAIQSSNFNCRFKTVTHAPKIDFDDESSRFATGDEGRDLSIAGARSGEINMTEKVGWAGSVTALPVWSKILRTCGHLPKKYSTTGLGFIPSIYANEITATIWVAAPEDNMSPDWTIWRYYGCHGGNGSSLGGGKVADPYMWTVKYMGAYVGTTQIPASSARALTSPDTTQPEVMTNNTVQVPARVNGVTTTKYMQISNFNLDFGVTVNPLIDQNTTTGYAYFVGNDKEPKLTINPYHTSKNLDDVDYAATNMITGNVTIKSPHITIELANAQMMNPALASREGFINTNRTYRALRNNLGGGATEVALPDSAMYEILIGTRS